MKKKQTKKTHKKYKTKSMKLYCTSQGRMQGFKLGRGCLTKLRRAEGTAKILWVFRLKKSRFYAKKSYFFQF